MPTNDFIGFASAGSANIMSQVDYVAAAEQTDGVQPGPASSALANKIWRQGANMAAALGEAILDQGYDALDNGDIAALKTNIENAFLMGSVNDISANEISNKSAANNTITNLGSVTLTKGLYLLEYTMSFATSSNGYRQIFISTSATGTSIDRYRDLIFAPASGVTSTGRLVCFMPVTSTSAIFYLNCLQTSGSTLNIYAIGYRIWRLK